MLAVVFWNARRADVDADEYAAALIEFHRTLNRDRPAGFRFSATYRVGALPWFRPAREIYEDWYVLSNFAAMDALDRAVLHGDGMAAHRHLMKGTSAASGAVFALMQGAARLHGLPEAHWLLKPAGVSADDLIESANAQLPGGRCSLWTRTMALGPTGHCLLTSRPVTLPRSHRVVHAHREPVWQPPMPPRRSPPSDATGS